MQAPEEMFAAIRAKLQEVLGDKFIVSEPDVVANEKTHGVIGFCIKAPDGRELEGTEVEELFAAHGGIRAIIGSVIHGYTADVQIPDSLDDETVAAVDPDSLVGEYGPHAGDFIRQIALMLALEWSDVLESLERLVNHFKGAGMDKDQAEHLTAIASAFAIDIMKSRQYLGSTLEGYRRDNELTTEQMATIFRAASTVVSDMGFDGEGTRQFAQSVRQSYNEAMVEQTSWPPLHGGTFEHYWEECEGTSH